MRIWWPVLVSAVLLIGTVSGAEAQPALYGAGGSEMPSGTSTFYSLDPGSGAATAIGEIGFLRCSGMDFDASGVLYATCERAGGSGIPVLITIDPATGAGTEVGPTGLNGSISDISFRPSDGVLFAYDALSDPDHSLFTIDPETGAGTLVGDTGLAFAGGNGMTFDLAGTLYHSQFSGGPNPDLNTLDPANGQPTFVSQLPPVTGRFNALATEPVTGTIYGVLNEGSGGAGPHSLATIDPLAGTATVIGLTGSSLDALAWSPAPQPSVLEVPTLGLGSLALLSLGLVAGGLHVLGRRSAARRRSTSGQI